MGTFTKKVEVVDARQFDGTLKNAKELVAWVTANGGEASWSQTHEVRHNGNKVISEVTVNTMYVLIDGVDGGRPGKTGTYLKPDAWILIKQDGEFDAKTDEQMKAEYNLQ